MGRSSHAKSSRRLGHHYDGIVAQHVSPGFENETVDNVKMIVLKFGRCQLWIEVEALLTDGLQRIVPRFESNERRTIGGCVVHQLTSHPNGKVQGWRWNRRIAGHDSGLLG